MSELTEQQVKLLKESISIIMEMHENTLYKSYKVNPDKLERSISNYILNGFVRLDGGCLMIGQLGKSWFGDELFASDVLLYTRVGSRGNGEAKKAVSEFILWAKKLGASGISIGQSTGVNAKEFKSLAEGLGMMKIGATYSV